MNHNFLGTTLRYGVGALVGLAAGAVIGDMIAEYVFYSQPPVDDEPEVKAEEPEQKEAPAVKKLKPVFVESPAKPSIKDIVKKYQKDTPVDDDDQTDIITKSGNWESVMDLESPLFHNLQVKPATFYAGDDILEFDETGLIVSNPDIAAVVHFDVHDHDKDLCYIYDNSNMFLYEVSRIAGCYLGDVDPQEIAAVEKETVVKKRNAKKRGQ